jgi:hypothetical protein
VVLELGNDDERCVVVDDVGELRDESVVLVRRERPSNPNPVKKAHTRDESGESTRRRHAVAVDPGGRAPGWPLGEDMVDNERLDRPDSSLVDVDEMESRIE